MQPNVKNLVHKVTSPNVAKNTEPKSKPITFIRFKEPAPKFGNKTEGFFEASEDRPAKYDPATGIFTITFAPGQSCFVHVSHVVNWG